MNKWVKISDYLFFQEGPGVRNNQYTSEGVKLLNVANLVNGEVDLSTSNRYISVEEAYGKYKHFLADEGDLIIASSGIKVEYFDKKMGFIKKEHLPICMNTSTIRFKSLDINKLNINYFMYYLKSQSFKSQLSKQITGSAQLNFGPSHLKKMKFPIVSLNEQLLINSILGNLDNQIRLKEKQIIEYDSLIKSRFVEMFGDVFSRKSKFKTKKIGELVISKVERASKYFDSESEIKYIDISSIDNSNNVITGYTQYFMKDAPSRAQQHVKKHDILISTVRPNLNNVAKVQYDFDNLVASSGFCVLRSTEIEPEYLFSFVSRNEFANYLSSLTTGASYPAVSDKDILNIEIPYPPKDKQLEFVNFHRQVDKLKFVVQKSLDETQKLFDSLMQEYFG
jgi:type I restriction enzyme S subunit